ncbi:MAG: hypothetical protein KJ955_00010 [Nanoarchaeota archaeon]|nr:hypothetical protein [Nanoarchaeota archaeon]
MPSLEDRLFYRLEANLNHRDEVIEEYRHMIDVMRDYSLNHDITVQLMAALNIHRRRYSAEGAEITAEDIGKYSPLHGSDYVDAYESMHGIKTFTFHIGLAEENRCRLMHKMGMPSWVGAIFCIPDAFTSFKLQPLFFNEFGIVISGKIGNTYRSFQHEALHMDKRFYSLNFNNLVTFDAKTKYSLGLWRAKFQAHIIDEVLSFMCSGITKQSVADSWQGHYWQYYFDGIFQIYYPKIKAEEQAVQKKEMGIILAPVKAQINGAVDISFYLKAQLDADILTPLFFALGPNKEEIKHGIFYGHFSDLKAWAILLNNGAATPNKIKQQLRKKGYCRDSVIFSYMKR